MWVMKTMFFLLKLIFSILSIPFTVLISFVIIFLVRNKKSNCSDTVLPTSIEFKIQSM